MTKEDCTLNLNPLELNQLLKICYEQQAVTDETAINLIAKINEALLAQDAMHNALGGDQYLVHDMESIRIQAESDYHNQRHHSSPSPSPSALVRPNGPPRSTAPPGGERSSQHMTRIVRSLETISAYFSQQNSLGFSDEALHQVIYCDGVEGSTWYYRDSKDQQPVLIPTPVLVCRAQHLEFVHCRDLWKLRFYVRADRPYCLEADYSSAFSKALLLALASLEVQQLHSPLSLEVVPFQGPGNVTCRVYSQGIQVMHHFGPNPPWRDVARQAIAKVEQAAQTDREVFN